MQVSRVATSAYTSKVDLSKSASSAEFQLINTASKLGQLKGAGLINVELRIIHRCLMVFLSVCGLKLLLIMLAMRP